MTIEYKDSKRITALSTDFTTPIVWQNMTDGHSASGNVLSKSGSNWTADATGTTTFSSSDGAKVEFTVSANTSDSFCGFDISTNTDSYNMDYALYCGGGGTINIYANGSQVTATSETYSTSDTLAVNMDSSGTVTFLKNGSVFYTSSTTASGTYRVNAVIYTSGVSLTANYITSRPTDVQDNSLLVEKDTARRYWFSPQTTTTEEVYAYTTTQSTYEKLSGTAQAYSSERAGVELVSSTFADKYIKTGKWNLKRVGTLGSNAFMKVEDSSGTVKGTSAGVAASGISNSAYEDVTFTLPTAVKLENGDRVYVQYTGADGSGNYLAFGEKHPSTTPTGWEYTIYNKRDSSGGSPSGGWGDDGLPTALVPVATFDSAPSTVTIPSVWNMQPTFEDDFSSDKGWLSQDSGNSVTGGSLVFKGVVDSTNDAISYDLGTALSDTNWICRFKLNFTTLTSGSGYKTYFGISSASSATAQNGTHDFIGMSVRKQNNTLGSHDVDGGAIPDGAENTGGLTYATGTDYYFEIIRLSSTTYEIRRYSDSTYSTISQTVTGTCGSTVTGLQYFGIWNHIVSAGDVHAGTLDDLKIYDGVTSIN